MKPTPAALSPVALLGATPPSEKRAISLSGADETVSSFEALLRATPGSRRTAAAASVQAADKTQLLSTESSGELDLLGKALQSSVSSRLSPGDDIDDESSQGLVLPEGVASSALPFWPAHLGAAWGGALHPPASGAGTPDGIVQTGLVQTGLAQAEPAQAGLAQASLAVTALGTADSVREQSSLTGSGLASPAAGQTEIPAGFVLMDPAREVLPALPVLPVMPASPLTLSAADQTQSRAPAEVWAKTFSTGMPISRAATSSSDPIQPQPLATPLAAAMSGTATPKPGLRVLSGLSEASGPRLDVEPRSLDSAGVVLAQFGAVSVLTKPHAMEQNQAPSAVTDVQNMPDARGAWVPELGGMLSPREESIGLVDFAQHLAEQVDTWVSQNLQVAEFRLQEPSANPVLVRIEMNGQQASVMFRTDVLACREALTTQIDQLSDLMSAQGLQLADASVAGSGADSQPGREARPSPLWGEPAARRSAPEASGVAQSPTRRGPTSAGRTLDVFV